MCLWCLPAFSGLCARRRSPSGHCWFGLQGQKPAPPSKGWEESEEPKRCCFRLHSWSFETPSQLCGGSEISLCGAVFRSPVLVAMVLVRLFDLVPFLIFVPVTRSACVPRGVSCLPLVALIGSYAALHRGDACSTDFKGLVTAYTRHRACKRMNLECDSGAAPKGLRVYALGTSASLCSSSSEVFGQDSHL